ILPSLSFAPASVRGAEVSSNMYIKIFYKPHEQTPRVALHSAQGKERTCKRRARRVPKTAGFPFFTSTSGDGADILLDQQGTQQGLGSKKIGFRPGRRNRSEE